VEGAINTIECNWGILKNKDGGGLWNAKCGFQKYNMSVELKR